MARQMQSETKRGRIRDRRGGREVGSESQGNKYGRKKNRREDREILLIYFSAALLRPELNI